MDEILLFLHKCGCHKAARRLTTGEIGDALGMSQQNVSRRLGLLEAGGRIRRGASGIYVTESGSGEAKELLAELQNAFGPRLEIRGRIADGLGEGRFYMSRPQYRKRIIEKLGFEPFPGTLNIRLDGGEEGKKQRLLRLEPVVIEGFSSPERAYGDIFAYPASVDGVSCAVVVPIRTHHGQDTVEIAAGVNLRQKLKKKTGDAIVLRID